jgi:excisionase family DNA binding protein
MPRYHARPVLEDRVYSTDEVMARLGVSRRTLYRLLERGQLKARRLGRKNVFLGVDVERFEQEYGRND